MILWLAPSSTRWDPDKTLEPPTICPGSRQPAGLGERLDERHVKCPECGKRARVNADGMIRQHRRGR